MNIRKPAVAGSFYPANKKILEEEINEYVNIEAKPRKAIGIVVPHAGIMYSGHVAGAVYANVEMPKHCIILSPNHTGVGEPIAIMCEGVWQMPGGEYPIDSELAAEIVKNCPDVTEDASAHMMEHSLEIQLPFVAARRKDFKFVPITVQHLAYGMCEHLGQALARSIKHIGEEVLIIASSDMSHYEPQEVANKKDYTALDCVVAMDAEGLINTCRREHISMCGVIPVAIMIVAAKELGAKNVDIIKYATSGDITGDCSAVVGYAGVIVD